jgi:hypothetical protein
MKSYSQGINTSETVFQKTALYTRFYHAYRVKKVPEN